MVDYNSDYYWVWYGSLRTLSAYKKIRLLKEYETPCGIFRATRGELFKFDYLTRENVDEILDGEIREDGKGIWEFTVKNHIRLLKYDDNDYPSLLKNIYDPPVLLYARGIVRDLKAVAMVGSRLATPYGVKVGESLAYHVARSGYGVISGLARGIDTCAHRGALRAQGYTIAVLGCGIDISYPRENQYLMEKIGKYGLILSEYAPGTAPLKRNFPQRNRIISGLCHALVVVEAKIKSGSLITVEFALEQGKEIFAIPGNIDRENSQGTNLLIKDGARPVLTEGGFLAEFESII